MIWVWHFFHKIWMFHDHIAPGKKKKERFLLAFVRQELNMNSFIWYSALWHGGIHPSFIDYHPILCTIISSTGDLTRLCALSSCFDFRQRADFRAYSENYLQLQGWATFVGLCGLMPIFSSWLFRFFSLEYCHYYYCFYLLLLLLSLSPLLLFLLLLAPF